MEATLLIVDEEKLPRGLEALLTEKGVFVESIKAAHLEAALIVAAPDLVLAPHSPDLDQILTVLRAREPLVQVVLIADWKEHKGLRTRKDPAVGAVLARDTPAKLLAGRIVEFCERAAAGEPLQRVPSLVPPPATVTKAPMARELAPRATAPRVSASSAAGARPAAQSPLARPGAQAPAARPATQAPVARPVAVATPLRPEVAPARLSGRALAQELAQPVLEAAHDAAAVSEPISEAVRISQLAPAAASESAAQAAPSSERVPLSFSERPLPPVRLALIDRDPTRSGALSEALRQRGVKSQLVAPDRDATRWHLLRRFSPHALVIDERGLESNHDWLDAIRLDPFLRHVPLLVLPLSRVFDARSGQTDLSLLVPHVLTLGVEEVAFQTQMSPTRHLEMRLDQLGPLRLFDCLESHPRPTRLECRSEGSQLSLVVQAGWAGSAELTNAPDEAAEPLDLAHALDWLLAHPEARVVVRETEPTTLRDSLAIRAWLDEATEDEAVPEAPQRRVRQVLPSAPFKSESVWQEKLRPVSARLRTFKDQALALSPRIKLSVAAIAGAAVLGGTIALVKGHAPREVPAAPAPSHAAARPMPPPVVAVVPPEVRRFAVSDSKLPGCDEAAPVGEDFSIARSYLQKARRALMAGDREEARALMCKAARLDPAGPASEGLAVLFLSDRSLDNADIWAQVVERNHAGERSTEELRGDIQSQRGDVAGARAHWVTSLGLTQDNTAVLSAVARTWLKDAAHAKKSRDLPRAERFLRRAVTLDAAQPAAALSLAELFVEQEMFDQAGAWAERVLELAPTEMRARLILGACAERRGAVDEAREHYMKIPDADPYAPKARERLAALGTRG